MTPQEEWNAKWLMSISELESKDGTMTELKTSESLLATLQKASKRVLTAEELKKQRVSFIMGSLKESSTVTRARIQEVLARQEGNGGARMTPQEEWDAKWLMSISELEISIRTRNCLQYADGKYFHAINNMLQLLTTGECELLRIPNFGRKSLLDLKEGLAMKGFYLGMSVPPRPIEHHFMATG